MILAHEIECEVLRDDLFAPAPSMWLTAHREFTSPDKSPVFYSHEIPLLHDKRPTTIRAIYDCKKVFGELTMVRK